MNHADVMSQMADYLEGDLPIAKRALFDAHLDRCEGCRSEVEEMRGTISLLRSMPEPETPRTLAADVMRRIRAGEAQPGLLDRVASWVDEITAPRVMVPLATFAAGMAVVLITGQVQLTLPGLPGDAAPTPSTASAPTLEVATADAGAPESSGAPASSGGASVPSPVAVAQAPTARPARVRTIVQPPLVSNPDVREFAELMLPSSRKRAPSVPSVRPWESGRADFVTAHIGQRGSEPVSSDPAERESRRLQSLDARLDAIERDPAGFADDFAAYHIAEQELWLGLLANRAIERGDAAGLVAALQASGDEGAAALASQLGTAVATREDVGGE